MKSTTFALSGRLVLSKAFVTSTPLVGRPGAATSAVKVRPGAATSAVRVGGVGSEVAWLGLPRLPELPGRLGLPRPGQPKLGLLGLLGWAAWAA